MNSGISSNQSRTLSDESTGSKGRQRSPGAGAERLRQGLDAVNVEADIQFAGILRNGRLDVVSLPA
ncbi:protein of unknown function [Methylocella tundrae]|uniref:Uncharacterized protein n=1 Tax=Methylocella tundrae TaxID=227605 RepID=A0A4U8Z3R0_METTU|nr:protein of unknown function [Methylocella tundrae]